MSDVETISSIGFLCCCATGVAIILDLHISTSVHQQTSFVTYSVYRVGITLLYGNIAINSY